MLTSKRRRPSSFTQGGRRLKSNSGIAEVPAKQEKSIVSFDPSSSSTNDHLSSTVDPEPTQSSSTYDYPLHHKIPSSSSSSLFQRPCIAIQRAPILRGLSVSQDLFIKKFCRPATGRRAYDDRAEKALRKSSLGPKRRMDGMSKLLARAGHGLKFKMMIRKIEDDNGSGSESDDEAEKEEDRPFEPLCLWKSLDNGGEARGIPAKRVTELREDEYGVECNMTFMKPAPESAYAREDQYVPPVLAKWLRPHQREGVSFMYDCVMGMRDFEGYGCILADDMGLGKTLQSVALIYSMLKTGITANKAPTAHRAIVVCPCSLVKNWDNEFTKWLGQGTVKTMALADSDRKTVEKNIDIFVKTKMFNVLIVSYETMRSHITRLNKHKDSCDLLVCDEAHRLKNNENQTSKALASLPVRRRVLLTGTPMQNDLEEFFAMVDFTNPGVLGTQEEFRKKVLSPVLRGREPDATESQKKRMMKVQNDMSLLVNLFILRRINTLNAEHLPPKLVQVVCCRLTDIQENMYRHLVSSKDMQHALDGKQVNCLSSIQMLMKLSNHPRLICESDKNHKSGGRRGGKKKVCYAEDDKSSAAPGADGVSRFLPLDSSGGGSGRGGMNFSVRPEWSGKMNVLYRLMKEMRKPGNGNDKIVIVSNYTQTLDLIGKMCRESSWGFCRLDGSIAMKKRQKMVEEFNDPSSSLIAFLLSSKAGGCGLNLIGGNRLVLFDPDWNPAVDKQAAARCWRDGQKKRCFTYRFLATGTVEEKIFQRQLSKEGLQSIVDDKEQVNTLSTKDLRNLFKLRSGTPSDTHDKLRCDRCCIVADNGECEERLALPRKLAACQELLNRMTCNEDAESFQSPVVPEDHDKTSDVYDKYVKQPMDLATIRAKLQCESYKSVSAFSKDVNRIFSNICKVWEPGQAIADAARRLQCWWTSEWSELVPRLMTMEGEAADKENVNPKFDKDTKLETNDQFVQNSRGDDFQEQIGMPEEENMRHWSHHYSTDTVDDPVLRAAMRGLNDVSFVFGLEVTWSLIQKRQQEEEEKQAMLEFEHLQQMEEASTNSVCSEKEVVVNNACLGQANEKVVMGEEKKQNNERMIDTDQEKTIISPKLTTNCKDEDEGDDSEDDTVWNLSRVFTEQDIRSTAPAICTTENCNLLACCIWESEKGEKWNTCVDCQEEDYGGWPEDEAPTDNELINCIHLFCKKKKK